MTDDTRGAVNQDLEDRIKRDSAEGRPAHPEMGPLQISLLLATAVVILLIFALGLALIAQDALAMVVGAIAVVMFFANPLFWVAILRARERKKIRDGMRNGS